MSETFYAVANETESIPPEYEWHKSLDGAKEEAVDSAEGDSETYVIYEITKRELYRTRITVELEHS